MRRECVLLIHGLGESSLRMLPLSLWLAACGYRTVGLDYPSTRYPAEQLAEEYVAPALRALEEEDRLHVVTHSLGGILLRYCLQLRKPGNLGRVVMQAPAHKGSEMLELYRRHPLFALYGPAGQQSGIGEDCFACTLRKPVDYEAGIIAGGLPLDPFSLAVVPWPQDGRVSAGRTRMEGMRDHIVIPAYHEFITLDPLAAYQTWHFLNHGRFARLPGAARLPQETESFSQRSAASPATPPPPLQSRLAAGSRP